MNRKQVLTWLLIAVLALSLTAVTFAGTVWLQANQTITARCVDPTGEIMVTFIDDGEALVTCRVWVER